MDNVGIVCEKQQTQKSGRTCTGACTLDFHCWSTHVGGFCGISLLQTMMQRSPLNSPEYLN